MTENQETAIRPGDKLATLSMEAYYDPGQPDGFGLKISHPQNAKLALLMLSKALQAICTSKLPDDQAEPSRIAQPNMGAVVKFGRG